MKEYEKITFYNYLKKKKETFGLLNNKRDKIRKQRNHHSILKLFSSKKRKGGYWIIYRSGSIRPSIFSISSSMEGKKKSIPYHSRAVCNTQKMPVRLFNSSIFVFFFIYLPRRLIMGDIENLYYVISSG